MTKTTSGRLHEPHRQELRIGGNGRAVHVSPQIAREIIKACREEITRSSYANDLARCHFVQVPAAKNPCDSPEEKRVDVIAVVRSSDQAKQLAQVFNDMYQRHYGLPDAPNANLYKDHQWDKVVTVGRIVYPRP